MTATMDDALAILEGTGPEYTGGLSNHGPMAAEALFALGRAEAALPWTERYRTRLLERPDARNPIDAGAWEEALGDGRRVGDWTAFFDRELAGDPWRDVLNVWAPRLAPGLIAAATHGVIRTGHAVRSLAALETPARLHELAEGLGYWAARYRRLPGTPSDATGGLTPSQALERLQVVPPDQRPGPGLIAAGVAALDGFPSFAGAINLVDGSAEVSSFLSDLTETFAGVYLANADDFGKTITFIHAVTGPSAVRLLAPHLTVASTEPLLRYAWQAAAALYAAFGSTTGTREVEPPAGDTDDLIDRAVATGDEHAIKFAEACLREHALNPRPVYLAAARHAGKALAR
jgi:hypothetical protein